MWSSSWTDRRSAKCLVHVHARAGACSFQGESCVINQSISAVQVCSNALVPLVAALAVVPITGGADVLLSTAVSRDAVRYLGAFFGEHSSLHTTVVPPVLSAYRAISG